MAYRKKYKPCILKYKALVLKYMPYIFRDSKWLIDNILWNCVKIAYILGFLCFSYFCINMHKMNACCWVRNVADGEDNNVAFHAPKGCKEGYVVLFVF